MQEKEQLIQVLHKIHRETGKIPRTIDIQNTKGIPKYDTFIKVFGSWKKALLEAGYNVSGRNFKKYGKRLI